MGRWWKIGGDGGKIRTFLLRNQFSQIFFLLIQSLIVVKSLLISHSRFSIFTFFLLFYFMSVIRLFNFFLLSKAIFLPFFFFLFIDPIFSVYNTKIENSVRKDKKDFSVPFSLKRHICEYSSKTITAVKAVSYP